MTVERLPPGPRPASQVIGIEQVDRAVRDWLDRTVDAHVETPTERLRKVPVVFASGERFATGRTRKAIRDDNGVLILPIISLRRTSVTPDPAMQALGTETPSIQFARRIDPKTNDLRNLNLLRTVSQRVPDPAVFDVYTLPFPDRSIMNYELRVQAQFIGQMNSILEKLFHSLNNQKSFLAPLDNDSYTPESGEAFELRKPIDSHYVVGFLDSEYSDSGNFEEFTDQERVVQWKAPVRVPATLQLDPDGDWPAVQVRRTAYRFAFGDETTTFVEDPLELERIFGKPR